MASNVSIPSSSNESTDSQEKENDNAKKKKDDISGLCPFRLLWSFGINAEVPLINLTTDNRTIIAYACSHVVIIYNYVSKEAITLQGHQNAVKSLSVSRDGKWLLSADFEKDSVVVIWDTENGVPVCTLFNPHGTNQITAAKISPNAKYIVTVGNEKYQKVCFWLWTYGKDEPNDFVELTEIVQDRVKDITFNEEFPEEFALTADHNVVFFIWDNGKIKPSYPEILGNVRRYGIFNCSRYVPIVHWALTATTNGYVLIWDIIPKDKIIDNKVNNARRKHIKSARLQKCNITVILYYDRMIVTGNSEGRIDFYDLNLKILYWFENCNLDSIRSISFGFQSKLLGPTSIISASEFSTDDEDDVEYEEEGEEYSESKEEEIVCNKKIEYLKKIEIKTLQNQVKISSTLSVNLEPMFRNHDENQESFVKPPHTAVDATFENNPFYIDAFFVSDILACGLENGILWMLHPITLEPLDEIPYKHSRESIVKLIFTQCAEYMAYSDNTLVVAVFKKNHDPSQGSYLWDFLGKYRSHCAAIRDILFESANSTYHVRFFSLGEDQNLIEYDLNNSGPYPDPGLVISEIYRIEYTAIPLCLSWYPDDGIEKFLMISNSEYKYRLLNDTTKMIRGTFLGPIFDTPVQQLLVLPNAEYKSVKHIVFATDKEIGLQIIPFDGNPYKLLGIVGHPHKITNVCVSNDGKILFTSGYNDSCVLMWKIKYRSVNVLARLGGEALAPYYCLIEGGRKGWLIKEMIDLFYYAQILHQGENTTATRIVSEKVSCKQIPNLMRAVGYYPSNEEIEILMSEISYRNYAETGQLVEEITFEDFVKLYINHRPVYDISLHKLRQVFHMFGNSSGIPSMDIENPVLTRNQFMNILFGKGLVESPGENNTIFGEPLTRQEAYMYLKFLVGSDDNLNEIYSQNERRQFALTDFTFLPEKISYKDFTADIMGIELPEETRADDE
ncbi:cilia- and flagella-associated protein 251 [Calliopsis andreniformis]|uniref:cilia- and flagella-associated protein 251 n=1 Tax=Calliopsis andreniformis TaxID=337506 RepID=UPI003FCEE13C